MGMRIQSSTALGASQGVTATQWQQQQQNFKDLMTSVKAGDLGAAQQAYAKLAGTTGAANGNSPLAKIGQALQNGDIAGAQSAATQLQASRSGHHHHGAQQSAQSAPPSPNPATGPGSLLNIIA